MQTNSTNRNHTTSIISSFICLTSLVIMLGCSKKNKEEGEKYITPITQGMIDIVEIQPGKGALFLANALKKLQAGENVDINAKDADNEDYTILHCAAQVGILSILKALIDRNADVNAKAKEDLTPLMVAEKSDKPSAIETLLTVDTIDVNASQKAPGKTHDGFTVLHWASRRGYKEIVKLLLADNRIEINKKDAIGDTPLDRAIAKGKTEIEKLLKEKGAV